MDSPTIAPDSTQTPQTDITFNLQFLCSLIPKPFDGNRFEFNEFLANCDNAMSLAMTAQKHPLLVFIISKLTGTVRSQLQGKTYNKWDDLRSILTTLYQDKKHYMQLMEELNTLKQGINESVASFHERIDKLTMRLLDTMTFKDVNEQRGKIETIKELALSRFIHHSVPDISRFLRAQNFNTISEAFPRAVEEERAIKISYQDFRRNGPNKICGICNKSGHLARDCFNKKPNHTQNRNSVFMNQRHQNSKNYNNQNHNQNYNNQHYDKKFCRYCKKPGHEISECRKREYNNRMKNQNGSNPSNSQNRDQTVNAVNNHSVHLNSNPAQVIAAPVPGIDISMA